MKPLTPPLLLSMLCLPLLVQLAQAQAAEPTPRDLHDAQCVAALDTHTRDLALDVKAGNEAARVPLQAQLVAGAAFVGNAYVNGNHDEKRARALADDAQEAQKRLPPAELQTLQNACGAEGTELFNRSSGLQQALVKRLAKNRMEKLLR